MKIRWTSAALRDLETIGDFTAHDRSLAAASRMIATIFRRVDTLSEFPHTGRAGRIPDTRELVVPNTPFIVPYRVRDETVEILAVFHGSRQWPPKFD